MPDIDLICLANSYKHKGRCIAGIRADGRGWIRPVPAEGGTLFPRRIQLGDSGEPKVLDLIRVGVTERAPLPFQPENYAMDGRPWRLIERPAFLPHRTALAAAVEPARTLFGSTDSSISEDFCRNSPLSSSLALVRPDAISWRMEYCDQQPKGRVIFRYGRVSYDLPLTDPVYLGRLKRLSAGGHLQEELGIPPGRRVLLTISLGEPYNGQCYKIVAAVVLVPAEWEGWA